MLDASSGLESTFCAMLNRAQRKEMKSEMEKSYFNHK